MKNVGKRGGNGDDKLKLKGLIGTPRVYLTDLNPASRGYANPASITFDSPKSS